jgi:hypothetical protein
VTTLFWGRLCLGQKTNITTHLGWAPGLILKYETRLKRLVNDINNYTIGSSDIVTDHEAWLGGCNWQAFLASSNIFD